MFKIRICNVHFFSQKHSLVLFLNFEKVLDSYYFPQFLAMEELDGDDVRLSYRGREAERDIVQVCVSNDIL